MRRVIIFRNIDQQCIELLQTGFHFIAHIAVHIHTGKAAKQVPSVVDRVSLRYPQIFRVDRNIFAFSHDRFDGENHRFVATNRIAGQFINYFFARVLLGKGPGTSADV